MDHEEDWISASLEAGGASRPGDDSSDDWVAAARAAPAPPPPGADESMGADDDDDEDDWIGAGVAERAQQPQAPERQQADYDSLQALPTGGRGPRRAAGPGAVHADSAMAKLCAHLLGEKPPGSAASLLQTSTALADKCGIQQPHFRMYLAAAAHSCFTYIREQQGMFLAAAIERRPSQAVVTRCCSVVMKKKYDGTKSQITVEAPAAGVTALLGAGGSDAIVPVASGSNAPPGPVEVLKGKQELQVTEHSRMPVVL